MIESAEEFIRLRGSGDPAEYGRAAHDQAPDGVWLDVIRRFPEYRFWVAHNKTVPVSILRILAADSDERVRGMSPGRGSCLRSLLPFLPETPTKACARQRRGIGKLHLKFFLPWPMIRLPSFARLRCGVSLRISATIDVRSSQAFFRLRAGLR